MVLVVVDGIPNAILLLIVLALVLELYFVAVLQLLLAYYCVVLYCVAALPQLQLQQLGTSRVVELHPEFEKYLVEIAVFFLHFLMVAATLLCLSCADEVGHALEDFVGSS